MEDLALPNIKSMRAFSRIIDEADRLNFPTFSNDGEFLRILEKDKMLKELGGRNDDYLNYFTARMLLLLESTPVFGEAVFEELMKEVLAAYFRDYDHHPKDFHPTFLVNDIIRFWKTLCLNYEHKRNQPDANEQQRIKQKVKNLKLKFSRMLTCYGTIAAIIDLDRDIGATEITALQRKTPLERLEDVAKKHPGLNSDLKSLVNQYKWFLELTDVSEEDLLANFSSKPVREEAFGKADEFGMCMFNIIRSLASDSGYMRYLLI